MRSATQASESSGSIPSHSYSDSTSDPGNQAESPLGFAANDPGFGIPTSGELGTTNSGTCVDQVKPKELNLVRPIPFDQPRPFLPEARFELMQQFEGTVIDIKGDTICARLTDRTCLDNSQSEYVEFDHSDLSNDDLNLVRPGAIFYWNIGYRTQPWGQRERVSSLRFRRMPAWTRRDIQTANNLAKEWAYMFENGSDESS